MQHIFGQHQAASSTAAHLSLSPAPRQHQSQPYAALLNQDDIFSQQAATKCTQFVQSSAVRAEDMNGSVSRHEQTLSIGRRRATYCDDHHIETGANERLRQKHQHQNQQQQQDQKNLFSVLVDNATIKGEYSSGLIKRARARAHEVQLSGLRNVT